MRRTLIAVLCLAACGHGQTPATGDGGGDGPIPPFEGGDPPPPMLLNGFVMSQQIVPANNTQARNLALDINGDGVVENQLGLVFATLAGQGFQLQAATTRAIDRGSLIQLLRIGSDD